MKTKVKAKVINGDWEIKKYKLKKNVNTFVNAGKIGIKYCAKAFFSGVGFATVFIIKRKFRDF